MSASSPLPHARPLRVGVLVGSDAKPARIGAAGAERTGYLGNSDFHRLIGAAGLQWQRLDIAPSYFRQGARWPLHRYDTIVNLISDPDYNEKCLGVAARLERDRGGIVNSPKRVLALRRDTVARLATGIDGLLVPKTLRLTRANAERAAQAARAAGFAWPGLLRPAGTHGGESIRTIRDEDGLAAAIDGGGSYYLTELVNFVSQDGLYRKWRFFVIGGEVVFRSLVIGDHWLLHRGDRDDLPAGFSLEDLYREERLTLDLMESGRMAGVTEICRALARTLRLDYFGIDCAVTSPDTAILFEANATMNFGSLAVPANRPHKARIVTRAAAATRQLVERAIAFPSPV